MDLHATRISRRVETRTGMEYALRSKSGTPESQEGLKRASVALCVARRVSPTRISRRVETDTVIQMAVRAIIAKARISRRVETYNNSQISNGDADQNLKKG